MKTTDYQILFVDDEDLTRKYFRKAFEDSYRVLTACDAEEGLAILSEKGEEIAILITDQRMPGKQGVELLAEARRNYPGIIRMLTTAYTDLESAISAVNDGFIYYYIVKPWNLKDLRGILAKAMDYFIVHRERQELQEQQRVSHALLGFADDIKALAVSAVLLRHDSPGGSKAITRFITLTGQVLGTPDSVSEASLTRNNGQQTTSEGLQRADYLQSTLRECLEEIDRFSEFLKNHSADGSTDSAEVDVTGLAQDLAVPNLFARAFEEFSSEWRKSAGLQPDVETSSEGCKLTISWEEGGNEGPQLLFFLGGDGCGTSKSFFKLLCAGYLSGGCCELERRLPNSITLQCTFSKKIQHQPLTVATICERVQKALEMLSGHPLAAAP